MKLLIKKIFAYIKILIPFTKITIKNIKEVIKGIKKETAKESEANAIQTESKKGK